MAPQSNNMLFLRHNICARDGADPLDREQAYVGINANTDIDSETVR
jgi:hypothetical protein